MIMELLSQASLQRSWILCFSMILLIVTVSKANYELTIRFNEFRNPLGLQCGDCESGGAPACCDDVGRTENCINEAVGPRRCDTRFRFTLRPFGASVETAPSGGFSNFTPSNGGNSETFIEGPGAFLGLMNPFTITNTTAWTGSIQFFIDALDRAARGDETEVLINRFLINLELELGATFTARANYTGIYNISDVEFDISFRVQCSKDYYGPNCATFCTPLTDVYECNNQGQFVCLKENREPSTNCTTCLPGYNDLLNCGACLLGRDIATNCTGCLPGHDLSMGCTNCLTGYTFNTARTQCIMITVEDTTAVAAAGGANLTAASGVVGAIAIVLMILVVALVVVIVLMVLYLRREKQKESIISDTTEAQTGTGDGGDGGQASVGVRHDVENPLYSGTEQGPGMEEKHDLSENAYTEVDHSPEQKPSEPSSFPYNTLEHGEDAPQKVDLGEEGAYDTTIDEPVQTQAPEDEASAANGTVAANGMAIHDEGSDMLSAVLEGGPKPSPSTLAGGIYDIPPQQSAATEATTSDSAAPPDVPAEHEYAETEINRQPASSEQQQSMATYTNTTPGVISEEAVNHYDLGQ